MKDPDAKEWMTRLHKGAAILLLHCLIMELGIPSSPCEVLLLIPVIISRISTSVEGQRNIVLLFTCMWPVKFIVHTGHMPLLWFHKLKETSARVARWKERLSAYECDLIHTKGTENVVADCLSRNVNVIDREQPVPDPSPRARSWTTTDGIINDRLKQIIFKQTEGDRISTAHIRLGRLSTTIIKVGRKASPESLVEISNQIMHLVSLYHAHFKQDD